MTANPDHPATEPVADTAEITVTAPAVAAASATDAPATDAPAAPQADSRPPTRAIARVRRRRRRRGAAIAAGSTAVALVAGGFVVAHAHKTVTLDVDGEVTTVTTFAGSVDGLLRGEGVELDARDTVAPARDARLRDGAEVVVRVGRLVTLDVDGEPTDVWVAALDAGDALERLANRGGDVRLVASRSGGRTQVPLRLDAGGGQVALVADGHTRLVRYEGAGIDGLLAAADVEVDDDDLVQVADPGKAEVADAGDARVAVIVRRVATEEVTHATAVPFGRVEQRDANRFADLGPRVTRAGVPGEDTRVTRVTTIDGEVVDEVVVSQGRTREPVDEVVAIGTRERPAPAPAPVAASGGSIPDSVWAALAQCESGGRPNAVSPGGRFHGLYQFSVATWQSVGGTGLPSQASPEEQRARAVALQARSGWGQWPACSRRLGLR
ncbi:resuscitation-promoting factor [Xylanimonas ulmi]|uniref:Uncharacterized protein YabE (DUF348 family) n=1 Tax=Xylanimonas ulmi TaxID=228973 RepID=A0A4Q7M205_9MICO|nr:resuscitation-promoting factor [Xylanibacterium ulmi]RZS61885.1 uncharacterized protein YabE (DUF348 family) [Xylanibacterium ulmi]